MPKTKTKKHQPFYRRSLFWVILVVSVLFVVAIIVIITSKPTVEPISNEPAPTPGIVISKPEPDEESDTDANAHNDPGQPADKVTQYEGENPNNLSELTGSIIYKDITDDTLIVAVSIDQFLSDGGTCMLTLTGKTRGATYTVSNPAFADVSTSACQTFEIPISGLPSDSYGLKIQFSDTNKTGLIEEEVNL